MECHWNFMQKFFKNFSWKFSMDCFWNCWINNFGKSVKNFFQKIKTSTKLLENFSLDFGPFHGFSGPFRWPSINFLKIYSMDSFGNTSKVLFLINLPRCFSETQNRFKTFFKDYLKKSSRNSYKNTSKGSLGKPSTNSPKNKFMDFLTDYSEGSFKKPSMDFCRNYSRISFINFPKFTNCFLQFLSKIF